MSIAVEPQRTTRTRWNASGAAEGGAEQANAGADDVVDAEFEEEKKDAPKEEKKE